MPYDPELAARIRQRLEGIPTLVEMRMFGGIGWTIGGNMAVGAESKGGLIVRCGSNEFDRLRKEPGAAGMEQRGRVATGWLIVDGSTVADDSALDRWMAIGIAYARSLPPK